MLRELTSKEKSALEWVGAQGQWVLLISLDGQLTKPLSEMTADEIRAAHDEAMLAKYVETYKSTKVAEMRSAGEQLVDMPVELQAILLRILTLSPERLQRIAEIVQEEAQASPAPSPEPTVTLNEP